MSLSMLHCDGEKIINSEGEQVRCAEGTTSQWFMMGSDSPDNVVDINNDSAQEIERKWSSVRTELCCKPMNDHKLLIHFLGNCRY